ncbi:MAG: DUF4186 domain-containing protein [Isosphaeraceae bacterium]
MAEPLESLEVQNRGLGRLKKPGVIGPVARGAGHRPARPAGGHETERTFQKAPPNGRHRRHLPGHAAEHEHPIVIQTETPRRKKTEPACSACSALLPLLTSSPAWPLGRSVESIWVVHMDTDELFVRLSRSKFRSRFRLKPRERAYLEERGMPAILKDAATFVSQRLAPAEPRNDGRQTPMGRHPVFVAQHATATCCRVCLEKWHGIPRHRALEAREQEQIVCVIERWLRTQGDPEN